MTWVKINCGERDAVMNDNRLTVLSSKTDPDGLYGKPEIFTEWGTKNETPVLRDVRWPGPQRGDELLRSPGRGAVRTLLLDYGGREMSCPCMREPDPGVCKGPCSHPMPGHCRCAPGCDQQVKGLKRLVSDDEEWFSIRKAEYDGVINRSFEAGRLSVLSGQQGVLVPRDFLERLGEYAKFTGNNAGKSTGWAAYRLDALEAASKVDFLLSGPVAEERAGE